jgi:hypothetical protein
LKKETIMRKEQLLLSLFIFLLIISVLHAFTFRQNCYQKQTDGLLSLTTRRRKTTTTATSSVEAAHWNSAIEDDEENVRVQDLLSDIPTPTLLIEMSLAESAINNTLSLSRKSLDEILRNWEDDNDNDENILHVLDGSIFIHTQVTDTSIRDQINREVGSGKSSIIATVDATSKNHAPGLAYVGIGLSNHHVGGYYWARGMGIGASLEAHGVLFREASSSSSSSSHDIDIDIDSNDNENENEVHYVPGELYWKRRDPSTLISQGATTDESSNSNDGKRSEWIDFLQVGDSVQLIPLNVSRVLRESKFQRLIGVRRIGRPLGADPIVERIWKRSTTAEGSSPGSWIAM